MSSSNAWFHILTEENPQEQELLQILNLLGYSDITSCKVIPSYNSDGSSSGKFILKTNTDLICEVCLFSGETASVDYIVVNNDTGREILFMESTQTTDKDSRNSAWFQRLTKFSVCSRICPGVRMVMYYTDDMSNSKSNSGEFGMRVLSTMGVEMWHPKGQIKTAKFTTIDELVSAKNKLAENSPSHNVPVRLEISENMITISGRLNKTDGRMDYDPNIGLFLGIINAVYSLNSSYKFNITNHGLDVEKIGMRNKFWYGVHGIDVTILGFNHTKYDIPTKYYKLVSGSEKLSTILLQHQSGLPVAFHNHAGCQRSSFTSLNGNQTAVPKKVTMPDVVLIDYDKKTLYLVEGKKGSIAKSAQQQLDALDDFEKICSNAYPGFSFKRGLCLYIDKNPTDIRYPVWFTLDPSGVFTKTLPT